MRPLIVILIGLALVTSACTSRGYSSSSNTCEEVAQEMITAIADFVDDNAATSQSDVEALGDDYLPADLGSFDQRGTAIQNKAEELECDISELEAMVVDGLDVVNADTFFGRILVNEIRSDGVFGGE